MQEFYDQKDADYAQHYAAFDCDHSKTAIRKRPIKGGSFQFVHQCLKCGEPQSNPIAKAKAMEMNDGLEPEEFDVSLQTQWKEQLIQAGAALRAKYDRKAWLVHYAEYLSSPEWEHRRNLVFKRAKNVCEGCGERAPTEVHHLTYKHVTREFLFELVALCGQCHDAVHKETR